MIYKCEGDEDGECGTPCYADFGMIKFNGIPCFFGAENPNWKQTDEYEIVKKEEELKDDINPTSFSNWGAGLKNGDEAIDSLRRSPAKNQTPNCAICEWKKQDIKSEIKNFDELNRVMNKYATCSAMAFRSVDKCYNSEECKNLFQAKPLPSEDSEETRPA